jgi:RHS repeat-associated protein
VTLWKDIIGNQSITHLKKYDKFGNVIKEQTSCCNERGIEWDKDNCWAVPLCVDKGNTSGVFLRTTFDHDYNTLVKNCEWDPNNLETEIDTRDAALRPTCKTIPAGATVTASYNDGALSASSSVNFTEGGINKTVTTSAVYDGWGRVIREYNEHGGQVNTTYDAMGRVYTKTNPFPAGGTPGPVTTYKYDALGRVYTIILPGGNSIEYVYHGNQVTISDQVNRKVMREVDGLGRLVRVVEQNSSGALAQVTSYSYDVLDNLVQVNQGEQYRTYKYDALGRLLYERIPEQTATINDGTGTLWTAKYTYTDFGAIQTRTDARKVVTTYGYDSLNRLTTITYDTSQASGVAATNNVTYTYDCTTGTSTTKGMLLSITMAGPLATYTETFSYDDWNRVESRTWSRDNLSYTIGYQYNTASQRTQITYPVSLRTLNVSHDSSGRLGSIADQFRTYLNNITYKVSGQVEGWSYGNGVAESFGYNNRLQMSTQTASVSGNSRMNLTYDYQAAAGQNGTGTTAGNAGQLMAINNNSTIGGVAESAAYTYDLQGRLVTSNQTTNGSTAQRRFVYDRWGNRTQMWDAVSGGLQIQSVTLDQPLGVQTNRIQSVTTSSGTKNYYYDAAGNLINDGVHSYEYDAENRLKSVDNTATAAYAYDYANRRIKKVVGGVSTNYVWEGNQVIAEHNGATGAVLANYVYGGGRMISRLGSGVVRYYLSDRLSVRMMLDNSGNMVGRQGHLPFGEEIGTSGEFDKKRFTTYERDSESGLDYAVNRAYSPSIGRFLQIDPVAGDCSTEKLNRYAYAKNDPINRTDLSGLNDCPPGQIWDGEKERCVSTTTPNEVTVSAGVDPLDVSGWLDDMFGSWSDSSVVIGRTGILRSGMGNPIEESEEDCGECCKTAWDIAWDAITTDLNLIGKPARLAFKCYNDCYGGPQDFETCFYGCLVTRGVARLSRIRGAVDLFFEVLGGESQVCNKTISDCWCPWA